MTTIDVAITQFNDMFIEKYQQMEKLAGTTRLVRGVLGSSYKWPTLDIADLGPRGAYNTPITPTNLNKAFVTTTFDEQALRTVLGKDESALTNADERAHWARMHAGAVGRYKDQLKITQMDTVTTNVVAVGTTNIDLAKVLEGQRLLLSSNIPDGKVNVAIHARQLEALLKIDRFSSSDYFTQSLVTGRVQNFLGMNWIVFGDSTVGSLPKSGNNRSCFMWIDQAIGVAAKPYEVVAKVWWSDEYFSWMADSYVEEGCSILDEKGIVKILCDETK